MFGFLAAPCPSCHPESRGVWQGHFCGLSTRLSRDYGPAARWLTNRDSTFLSLFGAAQMEQPQPPEHLTCCNPLGRSRAIYHEEDHARFASAVTICGLSVKLEDIAEDEPGLKRHLSGLASELLEGWVHRTVARLDQLEFPHERVRRAFAAQQRIESRCNDWRSAAEPTEEGFSTILAHTAVMAGAPHEQAARDTGASLGRLIYLLDAAEDLPEDERLGRFNPFLDFKWSPGFASRIQQLASAEQKRIHSALTHIHLPHYSDLIRNILLNGISRQVSLTAELASGSTFERRKKKKKKNKSRGWDWHSNCSDLTCGSGCDACCSSVSCLDCDCHCQDNDCCPCGN